MHLKNKLKIHSNSEATYCSLFTIHVLYFEQIRNICEFMAITRKICLLNYMRGGNICVGIAICWKIVQWLIIITIQLSAVSVSTHFPFPWILMRKSSENICWENIRIAFMRIKTNYLFSFLSFKSISLDLFAHGSG